MFNIPLILFLISLIGPLIYIKVKKITGSQHQITVFINFILFFGIGLQGILAFFAHAFMPAETAKSIGWAPAPQFQLELAFANLALGIVAIMAVFRPQLRLAAITFAAIYLWGCSYGHLKERQRGNTAPNNTGVVLTMDLVLPLILIILYNQL